MLNLIDQILARADRGETVAVCTVVRTRGSTPQKRGACMLVLGDGKTLGTLGGGCVEAEARVRAQECMARGASTLLEFKLDHDYGWDDGLVCGGVMSVAIQVIESRDGEGLATWRAAREQIAANREATVRFVVSDEKGEAQTFEHVVAPSPTLVIAGGGHVGLAVAKIARGMDFRLVVIDDRADFASVDRFGAGANCIVGEIDQELTRYPIDKHTYVVIVTRGHKHDGHALAAVIDSPAKYVGLIGSKRKVVTILRELHAQGVPREKLLRIHAPIGLDIGAVTPAEIAVSIAAELVATRRGKEEVKGMKITSELLDRALRSS